MAEINLMDRYPKTRRPIEERGAMKRKEWNQAVRGVPNCTNQEILMDQLLLRVVRRFDREYFDGDRLYGYGGYYYDPRFWTKTVRGYHCISSSRSQERRAIQERQGETPALNASQISDSKFEIIASGKRILFRSFLNSG